MYFHVINEKIKLFSGFIVWDYVGMFAKEKVVYFEMS